MMPPIWWLAACWKIQRAQSTNSILIVPKTPRLDSFCSFRSLSFLRMVMRLRGRLAVARPSMQMPASVQQDKASARIQSDTPLTVLAHRRQQTLLRGGSTAARLGPVRGHGLPRIIRPGMPRIATLQFLSHFGVGAFPEAAQILGDLDRSPGG
jgi:hypothetical protein